MEKPSVHQKNTKQAKARKKPIKVVYISNPMKVKASAAEFRGLVQELTGRDSNVADLSKHPATDPPPGPESSTAGAVPGPDPAADRRTDPCNHNAPRSAPSSDPFEVFDEAFMNPQMLENLKGLSPSPPYYEQQGHGFHDYDAS